jgi:hypothetical protein
LEAWAALSLGCCGLTFVIQNDFAMRVAGLALIATALSLAVVAL